MSDRRPTGERPHAPSRPRNTPAKSLTQRPVESGEPRSRAFQSATARQAREAEARRRVDEFVAGPLLRLWADWDRAWADLIGELIDGERDGFRAAGTALAEVGRLVIRADEFRGRDLSDLLVADVPNLLANCPPLPPPGRVLVRLRAMAVDSRFHTLAPPLAAGLLVAAAEGPAADSLAREVAEVGADARLRDAFGWFAFIRDRLLPPPGPPAADGSYTRTEAVPGVMTLDLHDLGRAEGLLPGLRGGNIEVEDEAVPAVLDGDAGAEPDRELVSEVPLEPWNTGTFAARVRGLVGRLREWHADPFEPPLVTLAAGDPAVALWDRETFRDATRQHVGRPEPAHRPVDAAGGVEDDPATDRVATLWLVGEIERQLAGVMHGVAWDHLRGLFENLLRRPAWATVVPPQDTAPLAFLAQQGRLVVVGRQVDDALLRGLEEAAGQLLVLLPDQGAVPNTAGGTTGKKKKKGRPPVSDDEATRNEKLYRNWRGVYEARGTSKEDFVRDLGLDRDEGLSAIEAGRYQAKKKRGQAGKKASG